MPESEPSLTVPDSLPQSAPKSEIKQSYPSMIEREILSPEVAGVMSPLVESIVHTPVSTTPSRPLKTKIGFEIGSTSSSQSCSVPNSAANFDSSENIFFPVPRTRSEMPTISDFVDENHQEELSPPSQGESSSVELPPRKVPNLRLKLSKVSPQSSVDNERRRSSMDEFVNAVNLPPLENEGIIGGDASDGDTEVVCTTIQQ